MMNQPLVVCNQSKAKDYSSLGFIELVPRLEKPV
jgi:hypothetical protein